jgi:predicted acyl esterase
MMAQRYEAQDALAVIDWTASEFPHLTMDGTKDPRVGTLGESYGGAVQLLASAEDPRIDASVPIGTWHDLSEALAPPRRHPANSSYARHPILAQSRPANSRLFKAGQQRCAPVRHSRWAHLATADAATEWPAALPCSTFELRLANSIDLYLLTHRQRKWRLAWRPASALGV